MPIYTYEARTAKGELRTGSVEASSKEAAAEILQQNNLLVTTLQGQEEAPFYTRGVTFFRGIKTQDVVIFSRQLATLFQAQVPLVPSLRTLSSQSTKPQLNEVISSIASDVDGGMPFSDALSRHPKVFSNFYVQMVKGGEASGKLDEVLEYLAKYEEKQYELQGKLTGAMYYPAFVGFVFVIIMTLMLVVVVPKLTTMFAQTGKDLPLVTKMLIGISHFLTTFWPLLVIGTPVAIYFIRRYLNTPEGKIFWDKTILRVPIVGGIASKMYLYRFADNLSLLIYGGVPIIKALNITSDIVGNTVYRGIIKDAEEHVRRGETIAGALRAYPQIPPLVIQMMSVGEQTGKLDSILKNVSHFYEKEVDTTLDSVSTLIQPVMIAVIALGVGLLVAGIYLPILQLSTQ
ncbi:MAG: type II secretion system F family protein [Candidatus Spechtbacteria bacterium]|nr:type II secretion system F family protein [Candidatus Spechtbacteria bacterium]